MAPRKQLADTTWQYSLGLCSFLVASGRVPGITLWMRDSRARCPRVRDKNICWSHRVVGCLSSPTENVGGADGQAASRMCPDPVRDTGRPRTQAQRSAHMETKAEAFPAAAASRPGLGAAAQPPTQTKRQNTGSEPSKWQPIPGRKVKKRPISFVFSTSNHLMSFLSQKIRLQRAAILFYFVGIYGFSLSQRCKSPVKVIASSPCPMELAPSFC